MVGGVYMKNKSFFAVLFFFMFLLPVLCQNSFAQNILNQNDHTKVMLFTLKHQGELAKWMHLRRSSNKPSHQEVLNFLYKLSDNRSSYDVHLILQKTLKISTRMRAAKKFRSLNPQTRNVLSQIKGTNSLSQLQKLLGRKNRAVSRSNKPLDIGIQIANKILQDGITNNVYSENTLKRFMPHKRGIRRGFWQSAADLVKDMAKNDAMGAITGAVVAGVATAGAGIPEGAVAGAIEASTGTVAEHIFDLVLSNPTPAY